MKGATLDRLLAARAAKQLVALVTDLDGGEEMLFVELERVDGPAVDQPVAEAVREACRRDTSRVFDQGSKRWFIRVFHPPKRLLVIGAVHIAQSLASMAREAGYAVTLIDPRDSWATAERFPGIEIDRRWPDEALADYAIDRRTAIVTLSHDPKLDEPALGAALVSDAFYVGALGSRRTHARRLERLRERGFDDDRLARIHAPVGLDIGAVSPAEIAISILAEMTQQLRASVAR